MSMSNKIVTYTSNVLFGYSSILEIIQNYKILKFKVQSVLENDDRRVDLRHEQIQSRIKI